jgi:hypothetical protein
MCTRGSYPEVKWLGHEATHSPATSYEIKNECSYTSTPPTCLHGMYKDNLTSPVNNTRLHSCSNVHSVNTKSMDSLCKMNTTHFKKSLYQDGIKIFDILPSSCKRTMKGREIFKIHLNILTNTFPLWSS